MRAGGVSCEPFGNPWVQPMFPGKRILINGARNLAVIHEGY